SKKNDISKQSEKDVLEELLPSSNVKKSIRGPLVPKKVTFLEEDEQGPVMEVMLPSSIVNAPASLTHDEVKRLLDIPLVYKILELGFGSRLSGDVAKQKEEIQGGLASHKLPAIGVNRI